MMGRPSRICPLCRRPLRELRCAAHGAVRTWLVLDSAGEVVGLGDRTGIATTFNPAALIPGLLTRKES